MAQDELGAEFTEAMLDIYRRAKDEVGYNASRFRQMVIENGGLTAAQQLLQRPTVSEGYERLWDEDRLDLSVEALILRPKWAPLFSEEELRTARERLSEFGYSPPDAPESDSAPSPSELESVLKAGSEYTRSDLYDLLSLPEEKRGGDWDTGYHRHGDAWFVFVNIDTSARTGHDYRNGWDGNRLVWRGRTGSRLDHESIQHMLSPDSTVYVFTRDTDRGPFTYQGTATPVEVTDEVPVRVVWRFRSSEDDVGDRVPGELPDDDRYPEGAVRRVPVDVYERNRGARKDCIEHWGTRCIVCGLDFGDRYGEIAERYIHVHHRVPLKDVEPGYEVDPVKDLRPVCPNCHAVIHLREPPLSTSEVRELMDQHTEQEAEIPPES